MSVLIAVDIKKRTLELKSSSNSHPEIQDFLELAKDDIFNIVELEEEKNIAQKVLRIENMLENARNEIMRMMYLITQNMF